MKNELHRVRIIGATSHHSTIQECDLGFRVVLDPTKDLSLLKASSPFHSKEQGVDCRK